MMCFVPLYSRHALLYGKNYRPLPYSNPDHSFLWEEYI